MSGERPGRPSAEPTTISVTSSEGAMIADAKRLNKLNRAARQARAAGLPDPAPTPETPRVVPRVTRTPSQAKGSPRSLSPGKPGSGETSRIPGATVPTPRSSAADEVRMSKREFEAVLRMIDIVLPTRKKPPTKGTAQT